MKGRAALALFVVATFASAFLIFLVQPLVAKRILPWFGGVPSVWTLCLAFYQVTLFAGYAYAHALIRFASPGVQVLVHAAVVALALLALPVLPGEAWRPELASDAPSSRILAMLTAHVAAPFLALAATGPLTQAWFARSAPGRSPYPLYAVSNGGSLLAIFAFPFALEPFVSLSATGAGWSLAFAATATAVLACGGLAWRAGSAAPDPDVPAVPAQAPRAGDVALWPLLSGSAVVMLMAVTNWLCLDVASVPFLWMLPLGLYLLSFVLCFGYERSYRRATYLVLTLGALMTTRIGSLFIGDSLDSLIGGGLTLEVLRYGLLLFGSCMLLHGELYRVRPAATSLTAFYLWVAGGGALGGIFVGVLAPQIFDAYHELPLGLALGAVGLLLAFRRDAQSWLGSRAPMWQRVVISALPLAAIAFGTIQVTQAAPQVLHRERSFFGLLRVTETTLKNGAIRTALANGTTRHGVQDSHREDQPSTYYGVATGIGAVFALRGDDQTWNTGMLGLGVGTLAAYGREGEHYRFYEIDPSVVRLAREHFSFLRRSKAEIEIVEDDGRLALEAEHRAGAPRFDLLVLDAYSSDAIPVHLLTREAVELYRERVVENGLLAFHVSNRHFDLIPVVARLGSDLGLDHLVLSNRNVPRLLSGQSIWVVLCADPARLDELSEVATRRWKATGLKPQQYALGRADAQKIERAPRWTDDYSSLFAALKPRQRAK